MSCATSSSRSLRSPLTGDKASAQLALRTLDAATSDKDRIVRYTVGIVGGANRLASRINDLMDETRMWSGKLLLRVTPIDLTALVSTVAPRYPELDNGCI